MVAETERFRQLAEEATKRKQERRRQQKRSKPPVKPSLPNQAELDKARAAVHKREHALKLAKNKEQKAQLEMRRNKLLEKQRSVTACLPDADEGVQTACSRRCFAEAADVHAKPALMVITVTCSL